MNHQPWNSKHGSSFDGLLGGSDDFARTFGIGQVAVQVARHRREPGSGGGQRLEVLVVPTPDLHGKAEVVDPVGPFENVQIGEDHLRADGQLDIAHDCSAPESATGASVRTDSQAAKAISSATRASRPVTVGAVPPRALSTKCANCAT